LFIERKEPLARRERRETRSLGSTARRNRGDAVPASAGPVRRIPAHVRDEVFARDRSRCTYVGTNGRRCASTSALQIDHVKPVARGGSGALDNLRLLCASHNRLEAERLMGVCYHRVPG